MYISEAFLKEELMVLNEGLINSFVEKITSSFSKLTSYFSNFTKTAYKLFSKLGLSIKQIAYIPKKLFKIVKEDLLNHVRNGNTKGVTKVITKSLNTIKDKAEKLSDTLKLKKSVVLFIILFIFHEFVVLIFLFLTRNIAITEGLLAIAIAPFTEEFTKRISIKKGYSKYYIPLFIWTEFCIYIFSYLPAVIFGQISLTSLIIGRLFAAMMHYTTSSIQTKALEKDPTEKKSYWISVLIHGIWNALPAYALIFAGLTRPEEFSI